MINANILDKLESTPFMFIEPLIRKANQNPRTGWVEVICGSMFSGKTEELIRRLNRAKIAKQKTQIFKPALDQRYHQENIVSHNDNSIHSTPITKSTDILDLVDDCEVVGIDEAQFFDKHIIEVVNTLADNGKRVIVAGLDMDYLGKPFGGMPQLMAMAEFVTKVHAICMVCGEIASHSYRIVPSKGRVLLGEIESYEARCRRCFNLGDQVSGKE